MAKNADLARGKITKTSKKSSKEKTQGKEESVTFRKLGLLDINVVSPEEQEELVKKVIKLYNKAGKTLTKFLEDIDTTSITAPTAPLGKIVEEFAINIKTSDELLIKALYIEEESNEDGYDLINHMLNVTILAIKLGIGLKFPEEELLGIGLSAIMHDLGMQELPNDLICPARKLLPSEYQEVKKHSRYGYNKIKTLGERFRRLADVVLSVHEREDGRGYPHGLADGQIHDYSKIIGLVDIYEALTHHRPYRKRLLHFDAMKIIIETEKEAFPKFVLKMLLQQVSTYPIKSYVKLNSGEIAQVVKVHPLAPLCPVVKIIYNSNRVGINPPKIVDLTKTTLLHIVGPMYK